MQSLNRNQSLKSADPHPDDQMDEEDLWVAEQSSSQLNVLLDVCQQCMHRESESEFESENKYDLKSEIWNLNLKTSLKCENNMHLNLNVCFESCRTPSRDAESFEAESQSQDTFSLPSCSAAEARNGVPLGSFCNHRHCLYV